MGKVTILDQTTKNPLSFMGSIAGIAYGTDTSDPAKNYKRGKQCILDGHGRMLEFLDVYMRIEGYSIKVIREFTRHVGDSLTLVQDSTRYINMVDFDYVVPPKVLHDKELCQDYVEHMMDVSKLYQRMLDAGVKREDASYILPLATETKFTIKKNARNLSDMCKVRLCNRAFHEYRDELMPDIVNAISAIDDEWAELTKMIFKAKCEYTGFCDEKMGCGKYPKK